MPILLLLGLGVVVVIALGGRSTYLGAKANPPTPEGPPPATPSIPAGSLPGTFFTPTATDWVPVTTQVGKLEAYKWAVALGKIVHVTIQHGVRPLDDNSNIAVIAAMVISRRDATSETDPSYGVVETSVVKTAALSPGVTPPPAGTMFSISPNKINAIESLPGSSTAGILTRTRNR